MIVTDIWHQIFLIRLLEVLSDSKALRRMSRPWEWRLISNGQRPFFWQGGGGCGEIQTFVSAFLRHFFYFRAYFIIMALKMGGIYP